MKITKRYVDKELSVLQRETLKEMTALIDKANKSSRWDEGNFHLLKAIACGIGALLIKDKCVRKSVKEMSDYDWYVKRKVGK